MKLRWFRKIKTVNAAQVSAFAKLHDVSLKDAKQLLVGDTPPFVLQQWDNDVDGWSDVPHEQEIVHVEVHNDISRT